MPLFAKLRAMRAFEKRHLHFLRTLEDFDLIREIGYHQEEGAPLTMKRLFLLDLASIATVQRRLRHLKHSGAIHLTRSRHDARRVEVSLSPKLLKTYGKYAETFGMNGHAHARMAGAGEGRD